MEGGFALSSVGMVEMVPYALDAGLDAISRKKALEPALSN